MVWSRLALFLIRMYCIALHCIALLAFSAATSGSLTLCRVSKLSYISLFLSSEEEESKTEHASPKQYLYMVLSQAAEGSLQTYLQDR